MDLKSYSRWFGYSRARDDMFKHTDTAWAPWYAVRSDDKKRAAERLQPPAQADPLRDGVAREGEAAEAAEAG